ncbi:MAG: SulP family inorganic anion transporter [Candidatus Latescibacterota bacterium]|nr:SulP family inorganic anion transporter [Candidatus Latescibacterota bacterium]
MHQIFPFLNWLPDLRSRKTLVADLVAGSTVAMVIIPQSMAYADLANLPHIYGLYAACVGPAIAALFGSSRHLATGPVAMASLISAATVQSVVPKGSDLFIDYALLLALLVGILRLLMGLIRLGSLVDLLSVPVIAGFTNAAALIIATSQLDKIFGVAPSDIEPHMVGVFDVLWRAMNQSQGSTILIAICAVAVMLVLRYHSPRWPDVLIAAIVTSVGSWYLGYGGKVIGVVPAGLPEFKWPMFSLDAAVALLPGACVLTMVGLMEAMAIAKTIATESKQEIDTNLELYGQGLANIVGSFFSSFVVSGSFSRSAINFRSGAQTGFSSLVTSVLVAFVLMWFTPILHYLPQATLAAIICLSVVNLIRVTPLIQSWQVHWQDGAIGVITFFTTLIWAPNLQVGIGLGVGLSLVLNLYRTMRPNVVFLTRHSDDMLGPATLDELDPDLKVVIMRFDGRLYFGSSRYFEDRVLDVVAHVRELRFLVIDAGGINYIDATGTNTLITVIERLKSAGIEVHFSRIKEQVRNAMERCGISEQTESRRFFRWNQHALEFIGARIAHEDSKPPDSD